MVRSTVINFLFLTESTFPISHDSTWRRRRIPESWRWRPVLTYPNEPCWIRTSDPLLKSFIFGALFTMLSATGISRYLAPLRKKTGKTHPRRTQSRIRFILLQSSNFRKSSRLSLSLRMYSRSVPLASVPGLCGSWNVTTFGSRPEFKNVRDEPGPSLWIT